MSSNSSEFQTSSDLKPLDPGKRSGNAERTELYRDYLQNSGIEGET